MVIVRVKVGPKKRLLSFIRHKVVWYRIIHQPEQTANTAVSTVVGIQPVRQVAASNNGFYIPPDGRQFISVSEPVTMTANSSSGEYAGFEEDEVYTSESPVEAWVRAACPHLTP